MERRHRDAIQRNYISLLEQTDLNTMVASLYEKGVFSERMIEPYEDTSRDVRTRKGQLYRDVMRRGPYAFGLLLEALTEAGHWDLVRSLDPDSSLHPLRKPTNKSSTGSGESHFVSIKNEKKKSKTGLDIKNKEVVTQPPPPVITHEAPDPPTKAKKSPSFKVVKSQKFMEGTYRDKQPYYTRSRSRGVLVVLSYVEFANNVDSYRTGGDVDCDNLKHLFLEIGFKVLSYKDLSYEETLSTLQQLKEVLVGMECVFIVVSSHGYQSGVHAATDVRCSDGRLVSAPSIIEHFNNRECPALRGIPKVFIFQMCRGDSTDYVWPPPSHFRMPHRSVSHDGASPGGSGGGAVGGGAPRARTVSLASSSSGGEEARYDTRDRVYSDILIANSTVPGYVSHRDPELGSWYIQVLCEVFAEHAHDTDVLELLTMVDSQLQKRFHVQTSSIDNWGFNRQLYLHPGLFED